MDLGGRRILITRPEPEATTTAALVQSWRGRPWIEPMLVQHPPTDPGPLQRALANPADYAGILVTSGNGARSLLANLSNHPRALPPVFAVGPKTAGILQDAGLLVQTAAAPFDGIALAEWILGQQPAGGRYLLLRAEIGGDEWIHRLTGLGREVAEVVAYRMEPATGLSPELVTALATGAIGAITFFSSRTAQSFMALLPHEQLPTHWERGVVMAALSWKIAQVLTGYGLVVPVIARTATALALLTALAHYWQQPQP